MLSNLRENLRRRWRRYTLEAIVVLGIFLGVQAWQARGAAAGPAPPLYGPDLNGELLSLPEPPGQAMAVHFWATWCGICAVMDGSVDSLAAGGRVLTVALQSGGREEVRQHLEAQGLGFTAILDDDGANAVAWGVRGVPTTFFVAADGTIRDVTVGYTSWLGMWVRLWLAGR